MHCPVSANRFYTSRLRRHVAGQLKAESEVAKESRKAREERRLAGPKKKPKKPSKGAGKAGAEGEEE